jgi:hypothetical protein
MKVRRLFNFADATHHVVRIHQVRRSELAPAPRVAALCRGPPRSIKDPSISRVLIAVAGGNDFRTARCCARSLRSVRHCAPPCTSLVAHTHIRINTLTTRGHYQISSRMPPDPDLRKATTERVGVRSLGLFRGATRVTCGPLMG